MKNKKFKQHSRVGVAGSFFNQMMSNNSSIPEVGKGATEMLYTDRYVYEVIEVSEDKTEVKLEALEAEIDPEFLKSMVGKDVTGHQNWILKPTGRFKTVVWRRDAWRVKYNTVTFTKEIFAKAVEHSTSGSVALMLTDEQREAVYADNIRPQNVVEGLTKIVTKYEKIKILFGEKNYHYDWSF